MKRRRDRRSSARAQRQADCVSPDAAPSVADRASRVRHRNAEQHEVARGEVVMSETVADFVMQRLYAWGVRTIYGYPGDGINGFLGALDRASERLRFVQVRHEELAAFMASAHAKFSGDVGVCMATSGPGAIHLLNGLYDAAMDSEAVVETA